MDQPLFERMAQNMTKTFESPESWHNFLIGLLEEVQSCQRQGNLDIGSVLAEYAINQVASIDPLSLNYFNGLQSAFGPITNASWSLTTDLHIASADLLNAMTAYDRGDYFTSSDELDAILSFKDAAFNMFNFFPGMSLSQRRRAHYHRGLSNLYMFRLALNPAHLTLAKSHAPDVPWNKPVALIIAAARDFQYAADIDPMVAAAEIALCKDMSAKTGLLEHLKPETVEIDLPGYGIWRGDPDFWNLGPVPGHLAQQMYSTFQEREAIEEASA